MIDSTSELAIDTGNSDTGTARDLDDDREAYDSDEEETITIVKPAPKFSEVVDDSKKREQQVTYTSEERTWDNQYRKTKLKSTERQALLDLQQKLSLAEQNLLQKIAKGDTELEGTLQKLRQFRQDLCFIGEPEYEEAIDWLADQIYQDWQLGKSIYFYAPRGRSETYIGSRVMRRLNEKYNINEKVDTENNGRRMHPIYHADDAVDTSRWLWVNDRTSPGAVVYFLDDFVSSGAHVKAELSRLFDQMIVRGFEPHAAASLIKAGFMVIPDNDLAKTSLKIEHEEQNYPINTLAYFGISPSSLNFTRACFTSIHCPLDYPFTETLKPILEKAGIYWPGDLPMLMRIIKPYDF